MNTLLSVVIPVLNEAGNLPPLLERLTQALAGQTVQRAGQAGLAPSVHTGWQEAHGVLLAVMDADLQHPPEVLVQLLRALESSSADLAIASRYAAASARLRWHPLRKWISRSATNVAQAVLPERARGVTDPMSGFFLLRRDVIDGVTLDAEGYKILLAVLSCGRYRRIIEVPYTFSRRLHGRSKLSALVMQDYVRQLWKLVWAPQGFGRFMRYCLVGASGVAVNMGVLWLVKHFGWLGTLRGGALAVECAILNNFLWNELWTFQDRSRLSPRLRDRAIRMAHFNVICGAGAAIQLSLLWLWVVQWGWHYLAANLLAIALVTCWNYGLNLNWTWTRLPAVRRRSHDR